MRYSRRGGNLAARRVAKINKSDARNHRKFTRIFSNIRGEFYRFRENLRLQEASRLTEPGDKRYADAVLQISAGVNKGLYRRLRGEGMCEALREIMAEDLKEAEKIGEMRGVKIGEERGARIGEKRGVKIGEMQRDREKITEMLESGKTPEAIADFCNYPIELVKSINKELNKIN